MEAIKKITEKLANKFIPTPNFFKLASVDDGYEILDVADGYMITYYHWIKISPLCIDCEIKKKSLFHFTINDYKLLTNNSWVILLALKVDTFIDIKYTIPFDDLSKGEIEYLSGIRPELFTLN